MNYSDCPQDSPWVFEYTVCTVYTALCGGVYNDLLKCLWMFCIQRKLHMYSMWWGLYGFTNMVIVILDLWLLDLFCPIKNNFHPNEHEYQYTVYCIWWCLCIPVHRILHLMMFMNTSTQYSASDDVYEREYQYKVKYTASDYVYEYQYTVYCIW